MPLTLPNLYCKPSDVVDYLGSEGVQLRLDDHNQATGNQVVVSADAAQGATTLFVNALASPLLRGEVLDFDGGGMPAVVEVTLNAAASTGATTLNVVPTLGQINATSFAIDNGVNVALAARIVRAIEYATARVKRYCCGRYDDSQLVLATSVKEWAMYLAAAWLCKRRGNSPPKSIADDAAEAKEELKAVQHNQLQIEDIGTRTAAWPFMSNVTVDLNYSFAKVRVEQPISEGTPTQYPQYIDWNSVLWLEY